MIYCVLHLITLWVSINGEEDLPVEFNRATDESVTFPVDIPSGIHINSAVWSVQPSKTIMAVLKPDMAPKIPRTRFTGRLSVPSEGYSLKMDHLTEADSGHYMVKIYTEEPSPIQMDFSLQVFRKLIPPKIEVLSNFTSVEGTCRIKLKCLLKEGGRSVTYSWKDCNGHTTESAGSVLDRQLTVRDSGVYCTCEARNPVSTSYRVIHPMSLCDTGSMGNSGGSSLTENSGLLRNILLAFIILILSLGI